MQSRATLTFLEAPGGRNCIFYIHSVTLHFDAHLIISDIFLSFVYI